MPKISKTSKMRVNGVAVKSFSLPAGTSCPGAKDAEVCKSCYAKSGFYHMPVVKNVREHNVIAYKAKGFVSTMVNTIGMDKYFRFFDSGDIESIPLARKIIEICKLCPNTHFWVPTRSDKVARLSKYILELSKLPNVSLRPSADNIGLNNQERPGVNSFVIKPTDIFEAKRQGIYVCPVGISPTQKSCDTCTKCYTDEKVSYVLH